MVVANLEGERKSGRAVQVPEWLDNSNTVHLEEDYPLVQPQALLSLRREVHRALSHGASVLQPPLSKL